MVEHQGAAWRFHLDSQQQAEVIRPEGRANLPTTANVCHVFAIHQIWALATGRVLPTIHTEDAARAANAALVSKIFDALCSALVHHSGKPTMP